MKCNQCDAECSEQAKFCEQCGAKIEKEDEKIICPQCGAECSAGAKFCEQCGAAFETASESDEPKKHEKKRRVMRDFKSAKAPADKSQIKKTPKKTIILLIVLLIVGGLGIASPLFFGQKPDYMMKFNQIQYRETAVSTIGALF